MATGGSAEGGGAKRRVQKQPTETAGSTGPASLCLSWLSSLQVTIVLLALAIVLILVGTLAQYYMDMWEVIDKYFRAWICWVDVKVMFPPSFFPWAATAQWDQWAVQTFPFPGGALIGLGLVVNLTAAHVVRFRLEVRGPRLVLGLAALLIGIGVTWLVIAMGHSRNGLQGEPLLGWTMVWRILQVGLVVSWAASLAGLAYVVKFLDRRRKAERWFIGLIAALLTVLSGWMFFRGESFALNNSSLRILYQLIQGELAAVALLIGCMLLFKQKAGMALLHGGIGLMMFGELFVTYFAAEQQMPIVEGGTATYAQDIRAVELAVADAGKGPEARGIGIEMSSRGRLSKYADGTEIDLPDFPFKLLVVKYFRNSELRALRPAEKNLATAGLGQQLIVEPLTPSGGVQRGRSDQASAYVRYVRKSDGEDLGTYLHSQFFSGRSMGDLAVIDGRSYRISLRYERDYKPYTISLIDVRKDDYVGTQMARNYASVIRLEDPTRKVEFEAKIWMNNPLRYAGETFYQSGYQPDVNGREMSVLQVVKNTGWMIPYVSCMIVATGMLVHFLVVLIGFLRKHQVVNGSSDTASAEKLPESRPPLQDRLPVWIRLGLPAAAVLFGVVWIAGKARPDATPASEMQLEKFAQLPVMFEGRAKPFGTLARTSLRMISNRETFTDAEGEKQGAVRWLLDVMTRTKVAESHPVFRIDSHEVLDSLGLNRRKGNRYAFREILTKYQDFHRQVALAAAQAPALRTFQQRKMLDLQQRINRYQLLVDSFRPLPIPKFPTKEETSQDPEAAVQRVRTISLLTKEIPLKEKALAGRQPPRAVPTDSESEPWLVYATARNREFMKEQMAKTTPPAALQQLTDVLDAYRNQDATSFNQAVAVYQDSIDAILPAGYDARRIHLEEYFNYFAPFYQLIPLYVLALLLTVFGWMTAAGSRRWSDTIRSSAFWLVMVTLLVHSGAMVGRVIISGNAPVTNLYSSAIFIGWGAVILGLVLESLYRYGIGNFVAAVTGIGTLLVAHFLSGDGDTIRVLQAVLDTQFWLTVHVLTVTLGYSATFLAGFLGLVHIAYLFLRHLVAGLGSARSKSNWRTPTELEKTLAGMIYGTMCFAVFTSFVGTVLGGLWADDSWGRFWGWDPKENGALIIVLWTALILHARWIHLVRERGMALLAVAGNIVTAWSWFGVNELGIGLHSYGFTDGVARALLIFWLSQFAIIGVGVFYLIFVRLFTAAVSPDEGSPPAMSR